MPEVLFAMPEEILMPTKLLNGMEQAWKAMDKGFNDWVYSIVIR